VAAALLVAVLCLVGAADDRVQLELRLDGEARTQSVATRDTRPRTRGSAEAIPNVALALGGPGLRLSLAYHPLLSTPDLFGGADLAVLHRLDARAETRVDRTWRAAALAAGSYGESDPVTDLWREVARLSQPIPTTATFRRFSAQGGLGVSAATSRRTTATLEARGFASGGTDAASRVLLPVQRGVSLDGALTWSASRRDSLALQLAATAARLAEATATSAVAVVFGTWHHRLARPLDSWAGLGVATTVEDRPGDVRRTVRPAAELGVAHTLERAGLSERLVLRAEPSIDRFSNSVDERLAASGSVDWAASRRWSLGARARAERVLASAPTTLGGLEVRGGWRATERASLSAGFWGQWQHLERSELPSFFEGGTFLGFSVNGARR
jgi:hypothetical protein